jgi:hypothetical protein
MAIDPDTVYDIERAGESIGTVTVQEAAKNADVWFASATFKSLSQPEPTVAKASTPKPTKSNEDSDERPYLHRGGQPQEQAPATTTAPASSTTSSPNASGSPASTTSPTSATPVSTPSQTAPAEPPTDPNRPVLRRERPSQSAADVDVSSSSKTPTVDTSAFTTEYLVAVSDVGGPTPHTFAFDWRPAEQQKYTRLITAAAQKAIADWSAQRYGTTTGPTTRRAGARTRSAAPSSPTLEDVSVHAYDVDTDNNPEIVLTARERMKLPESGPGGGREQTFYIAYVVRGNDIGEIQPLLSYITDENHLDQFPRLTFVDVVDANGDGIGEFLFRASSAPQSNVSAEQMASNANDWTWSIYRTGPDHLTKVFDTAERQ